MIVRCHCVLHLFLTNSSACKIHSLFSTDRNFVIKVCSSCCPVSMFFFQIRLVLSLFSLLPGILNLPAVALGIITGGFILKRFKLGVIGAARVSMAASIGSFCLMSVQVFIHCDNAEVAGLTVTYQGWEVNPNVSFCIWLAAFNDACLCPSLLVPPRCRTATRPCCRSATWDAPARSSTGTQCAQPMGWRTPHPAWPVARLPQAVARKWWVDDLCFLPGRMKRTNSSVSQKLWNTEKTQCPLLSNCRRLTPFCLHCNERMDVIPTSSHWIVVNLSYI